MRQAAALADAAGEAAPLVAAALLHDVGHPADRAPPPGRATPGTARGAGRLCRWFGPAVTEPVRLHMAAKRYLCAIEPGYSGGCPPSRSAPCVQGGPMNRSRARPSRLPHAPDAVAVRRWDDRRRNPRLPRRGSATSCRCWPSLLQVLGVLDSALTAVELRTLNATAAPR